MAPASYLWQEQTGSDQEANRVYGGRVRRTARLLGCDSVDRTHEHIRNERSSYDHVQVLLTVEALWKRVRSTRDSWPGPFLNCRLRGRLQ